MQVPFVVIAGNLGFNVLIYVILAFGAISLLFIRRMTIGYYPEPGTRNPDPETRIPEPYVSKPRTPCPVRKLYPYRGTSLIRKHPPPPRTTLGP